MGLAGGEAAGIAAGREAQLKDGHRVTVLGFADKWLGKENISKWKVPHPPLVTLDMASSEQKVLALSIAEPRAISSEQILELQPGSLKVVDSYSLEGLYDWALQPDNFDNLLALILTKVEGLDDKAASRVRERQAQFTRMLVKAVETRSEKFEELVREPAMAQKLLKKLMALGAQPVPTAGLNARLPH